MQKKRARLRDLSRLRLDLRRLLGELERSVEIVLERAPLVRGTVYELARKCGKPGCACRRGRLHRSMVLSWSERGRTRLMPVADGRLEELRDKSAEYLRFRQARARIVRLGREMLALLDRIERLRREAP